MQRFGAVKVVDCLVVLQIDYLKHEGEIISLETNQVSTAHLDFISQQKIIEGKKSAVSLKVLRSIKKISL